MMKLNSGAFLALWLCLNTLLGGVVALTDADQDLLLQGASSSSSNKIRNLQSAPARPTTRVPKTPTKAPRLPTRRPRPRPCESSGDCWSTQYCRRGFCANMGTCRNDADCFNSDNQYPVILCVGPLSCNSNNRCGVTCSDSNCPAGQPEVQCLVSPCSVIENSCDEEISSCVDHYCGGCNAFAFDSAGNRVCQAN